MGTNTGIGIGIGIPFKNNALGGDRPYLPPELKARLIGVWDNYGKKNTDADRNIIKNKIPNAGGDLEILNAAYEGMSGYNGYPVIFGINKTWKNVPTYNSIYSINDNKIHITKVLGANRGLIFSYVKQNDQLYDITEIPSFKIRVSGLKGDSKVRYSYIKTENAVYQTLLDLDNGIHELPKSLAPTNSISNNSWIGFTISPRIENETSFDCDITIEILPEYEGAFVTDGVNDMIISQKTLQEMGVTKELTIVSMIHQISYRGSASVPLTNYIRRPKTSEYVRNHVSNIGKTGIYGYVCYDISNSGADNSHVVNTILGDKNDYSVNIVGNLSQGKFSVQGYIDDNGNIVETSSVAHYWTFALLGKATEDDINLIIGYFNLDRTLKADIYYNIERQGITNDNHAEFNDKLIDYSGNGRDLQLFNIGWNSGSGIGKYVTNFGIWSKDAESKISYNSYSFTVNGSLKRTWLMWYVTELPSFKIKVSGINSNGYVDYGYYDNGSLKNFRLDKDGIHTLPPSGASSNGHGFKVNDTSLDWTGLVIEQIPDFAGALCFDGVDDYGQFVGDLGLKDYTVVIDRAYPIVSTPQFTATSDATGENANTPFLIEHRNVNANESTFSYLDETTISINKEREICYQSTYQYKDTVINKGSSTSLGTGLTIARYGINNGCSALALYSFMLFHYSMSKFLIERQLKKHKLGTLYPGMVEFRPIISGRTDLIKKIKWYSNSWSKRIYVGDYIPKGVDVTANILLNDNTSELVKATYGNNYTEVRKQANWSETNNEWDLIIHNIGKSPQKIGITIDKYIRFEDIVQPYPVKFRFTDVDSGQVYDWGSKIKVGSTIKILSNVDIGDYLSDIYTITGYKYNGNIYSYNELKELTFLITNQPLEFASRKTYKLGGSEPKVILYPERLKLSNDTYKRLGYIPDLTGNGNHGVFNNLAFTEESGVNEDGSMHLDGVDDYISIPTLSKGGKQVLMKVNWQKQDTMLYNQSPGQDNFAIFTNDYNNNNLVVAYASRNNGNTYIDGVVNNNILATQLKGITHNIVATNNNIDATITPIIGSNKNHDNFFAQMALYAFMLFDEISTDEGIKDLNDIVGIVSKVELPPYYWDTYGKTNTDADRDEIVNLASDEVSIQYPTDFTDTSVWEDMGAVTSSTILTLTTWVMGGDTGIGNTIKAKVATPAMKVKFITDGNGYLDYMYSGYNTLELPRDAGEYEVELPASTIVDGWGARFSGSGNGSFTIELLGNEVRLGTLKVINSAYDEDSGYGGAGLIVKFSKDYHDNGFWKFVENRSEFNVLNNGDSVNIINAKSVETLFYMAATTKKAFYKVTGVSTGKGIKFGTDNVSPWEGVIAEKDGIYEVDWSLNVHTGTGDLLAPCILSNGWLGDCNIVIEQVKQYPNGIALDGVDDSLVNTDIPAFTDFTVIAKRIFLGDQPNNVVFLFKGDKVYDQGVGNALLMEYRYNNGTYANYIFSNANSITLNEGDISYVTPTDYNGQQMNYVVNTDNKGLVIGRSNVVYWKGVFYKLMLYPKTIDMLSINMLKNLFERDEIIDLNNPIFIKDE